MHITLIMSLHYPVKHKYLQTNDIVQSLDATSSIMGQLEKYSTVQKLTYVRHIYVDLLNSLLYFSNNLNDFTVY